MDTCRHVLRLSPSANHSVLNPQKWHCEMCGTTESVWACLSCPHVACGRYISEHALKHFKETHHPLAIEVNDKYVYCYECDEYVLNDNASGDVKILRSCLSAVVTQQFHEVTGNPRGKRLLRSCSYLGAGSSSCYSPFDERKLRDEDLSFTALWFRRYYLLAKAFSAWKQATPKLNAKKKVKQKSSSALVEGAVHGSGRSRRKQTAIVPGVTGLRNLGNTCYMNSVLQVLSNLHEFRQCFAQMPSNVSEHVLPQTPGGSTHPRPSLDAKSRNLQRQTTMECFQHVSEADAVVPKGGLNGGATSAAASTAYQCEAVKTNPSKKSQISLCKELHTLLRVMWSGKWALVSPHKMLNAVWTVIPFFKGYSQQDAQEFLCEFLDKVQSELERLDALSTPRPMPSPAVDSSGLRLGATAGSALPALAVEAKSDPQTAATDPKAAGQPQEVLQRLFQGELVSVVTCCKCGSKSRTFEPFMDLSLDFPERYHWRNNHFNLSIASCHVKELLEKFTEVERLEGRIYACEKCNRRQRKASPKPTVRTEAEKCFQISRLPTVLRLHLKRFMWSGRNHRGKISVHVDFEDLLDLSPYLTPDMQRHLQATGDCVYRLSAVVMHHGRGFGSGHYTAYCWNKESNSWLHCNDAKMEVCAAEDVCRAQAYILIYTQQNLPAQQRSNIPWDYQLFDEQADGEITFNFRNSSIPKFVELKRKLGENSKGRMQLKRRKSTIW